MSNIPRFWRNLRSRYNLTGTKCLNCGEIYFPPRNFCPKCRRMSRLEEASLNGRGEVLTYTIIHAAPGGFEVQAPYIMAIVQLEEGPRLTTQIVDCEPDEIKIGMKVERVFRKIQEDGEAGLIYYGYKFKPVEDSR
jgi:hypothetical protein